MYPITYCAVGTQSLVQSNVGLVVGCLYSLLGVQSPAPPAVALAGLLGSLIGEQAFPRICQALAGQQAEAAVHSEVRHRHDASTASVSKPAEHAAEAPAAHSRMPKNA